MSLFISKSRSKRSKLRSKAGTTDTRDRGLMATRVFTVILLWAAMMLLVHGRRTPTYSNLAPGQRAPATVLAAVDFECLDIGRTELNRREAAVSVPPVFTINRRPLQSATHALDKLFGRILRLRKANTEDADPAAFEASMSDVLDLLGLSLTTADAERLAPAGREEEVLEAVQTALTQAWERGVISSEERETAFFGAANLGRISLKCSDVPPIQTSVSDLQLPDEALQSVVSMTDQLVPQYPVPRDLLSELLAPWMVPNLLYDQRTTDRLRAEAEESVSPVEMLVSEDSILAERGKLITPQIVEQLRAHEIRMQDMETPAERQLAMIGNGAILLIAILICGIILRTVAPQTLRRRTLLLLLLALSLAALLPAKGLLHLAVTTRWIAPGLAEYMLPVSLAPLLATVFLGGGAAIAVGLGTSLATALLFGNSFTVFAMGLTATAIAAEAASDVRRRSQVFRAGLWIGLGKMAFALGVGALNRPDLSILAGQAAAGLISGLVTAGIVLLVIPLVEFLFGLTTNITLLEYSDPGHPLLQRLAKEAPGTYHHSLMVADLARAAAEAVRANPLLARVCAYFHDIGKLTKPEFFAENQQYTSNPHDELEPSMSTLIITAHVKEGVALARQHKLPQPIVEGIQQHHGTSLIAFFYHRAKKQKEDPRNGSAGNERGLNDGDFRYEGPKPSSRETGILLLADSVEAASRSMTKPTATRIETLVKEIVDARIQDGQLDQCDLTMSDLSAIRASMVFSLTSMLHSRIEYPEDESRNQQSPKSRPVEPVEDTGVDAMVDASRTTT